MRSCGPSMLARGTPNSLKLLAPGLVPPAQYDKGLKGVGLDHNESLQIRNRFTRTTCGIILVSKQASHHLVSNLAKFGIYACISFGRLDRFGSLI